MTAEKEQAAYTPKEQPEDKRQLAPSGTVAPPAAATPSAVPSARASYLTERLNKIEEKDQKEDQQKAREATGGKGVRAREFFKLKLADTKSSEGRDKKKTSKGWKGPWYILDPRSRLVASWDALTSLALIFTAIATPFEVAFLPAPESAAEPLWIVNRLIDVIFICDMIKEFFLAYPAHKQTRKAEDSWEMNLGPIAKRYMRGWFGLDVASIFPSAFDIIPVLQSAGTSSDAESEQGGTSPVKALRVVRALRLIKLIRLLRASRVLKRISVRYSFPRLTTTTITLSALSLALGHAIACMIGMLVAFAPSPLETWAATYGYCAPGSIKSQELPTSYASSLVQIPAMDPYPEYVCVGPWAMYFQSLRWSLGLLFGMSREPSAGPLEPYFAPDSGGVELNLVEQTMQLLGILCGIFFLTIVTGVFVEAITTADPALVKHRQELDNINRMIVYFRLPLKMAIDLRMYHRECKEKMRAESRLEVVNEVLGGERQSKLSQEIMWEVNKIWLIKVACFKLVDTKDFFIHLTQLVHTDVFVPSERPPAQKLYVIQKGTAYFRGQRLDRDDCWGAEDVLLRNKPNGERHCALTLTYVHTTVIEREDIEELGKQFPKELRKARLWTILYDYCMQVLRDYRKMLFLASRLRMESTNEFLKELAKGLGEATKVPDLTMLPDETVAWIRAQAATVQEKDKVIRTLAEKVIGKSSEDMEKAKEEKKKKKTEQEEKAPQHGLLRATPRDATKAGKDKAGVEQVRSKPKPKDSLEDVKAKMKKLAEGVNEQKKCLSTLTELTDEVMKQISELEEGETEVEHKVEKKSWLDA